jgi:hypothetical protein
MVSSEERRKLIEAYADRAHNGTALPLAIAGLLVIVGIAAIVSYLSDEPAARTTPVNAQRVVSGR